MPSVTLNKGRYWVGNPKTVFPDWVPSPSCTYRAGPYTFHAFQFGDTYVAAIPEAAMPPVKKRGKEFPQTFMTFNEATVFFENNGSGFIGKVEL